MTEAYTTRLMQRAIELAATAKGNVSPEPMRGAVIAQHDQILGEGYYAHHEAQPAELYALQAAGKQAQGASLYLNLEPAFVYRKEDNVIEHILAAGIQDVWIAVKDPNPRTSGKSIEKLEQAGLQVHVGLCADMATQLNEFYFKEIQTRRPFVTMLTAMSLDGKIATHLHDSANITDAPAQEYVHRLRADYDAVMIGINTILQDNPQLSCKHRVGHDPWRIIIDSQAKTPVNSKLFLRSGITANRPPVMIVTSEQAPEERTTALRHAGAEIIRCSEIDEDMLTLHQVDLARLMPILSKRGIISVLLEGGSTLKAAALKAGIVDKVCFIVAPKLIGGHQAPSALGGEGVGFVDEAVAIRDWKYSSLGADLLIEGYVAY